MDEKVGLLDSLSTEDKSTVVAAINEIGSILDDLIKTANQNNQNFQQSINTINSNIGTINSDLDTKTNKNEYTIHSPYKGDGVSVDLDTLENGAIMFPGSVPVLHAPNDMTALPDSTIYQPKRAFGWQLLGDGYKNLYFRKFSWNGTPYDWSQIAFTSMLMGENLLINPDFKINQRGVTELTSNGRNQYLCDRWFHWDNNTTSVAKYIDNHYVLYSGRMGQYIENLKAGTYAITIKILSTDVKLGVYKTGGSYIGMIPEQAGTYSFITTLQDGLNHFFIQTLSSSTNGVVFDWIKIELGTIPTPFVPPNPGIELLKCKRYYQEITGGGIAQNHTSSLMGFLVKSDVKMRTTPTLSIKNPNLNNKDLGVCILDNAGNIQTGFEFNLYTSGMWLKDVVMVNAVKENHGLSKNSVYFIIGQKSPICLDAELY